MCNSGSSCDISSSEFEVVDGTGTGSAGVLLGAIGFKISAGRIPRANAAASDAGRLAASDEMIFLRNL